MWIFTSKGMISVVQNRQDPGAFMVRARSKNHIQAIFPNASVYTEAGSDYKWRASVDKLEFIIGLAIETGKIKYDNFKNSIPDDDYHEACSQVWSVMFNYQRRQK